MKIKILPLLLLLTSAGVAYAEETAASDKAPVEKKEAAKESCDDCGGEKNSKSEANKEAAKPAPAPASETKK